MRIYPHVSTNALFSRHKHIFVKAIPSSTPVSMHDDQFARLDTLLFSFDRWCHWKVLYLLFPLFAIVVSFTYFVFFSFAHQLQSIFLFIHSSILLPGSYFFALLCVQPCLSYKSTSYDTIWHQQRSTHPNMHTHTDTHIHRHRHTHTHTHTWSITGKKYAHTKVYIYMYVYIYIHIYIDR